MVLRWWLIPVVLNLIMVEFKKGVRGRKSKKGLITKSTCITKLFFVIFFIRSLFW